MDEKQSDELASLELPDHSPEVGRRMSWLWAARRAFKTMDTSHRLRRALLAGVRARSHTQGIVNGELAYVWRRIQPLWLTKKRTVCSFCYRGRVTKVAPECLEKTGVAEQMSWDITTKEKVWFEKTLDGEDHSWEEPMLDESGGSLDTEMPDMAAEQPTIEGETVHPRLMMTMVHFSLKRRSMRTKIPMKARDKLKIQIL